MLLRWLKRFRGANANRTRSPLEAGANTERGTANSGVTRAITKLHMAEADDELAPIIGLPATGDHGSVKTMGNENELCLTDFPRELILVIFSYLDAVDVVNLTLVSALMTALSELVYAVYTEC